MSQKTSFYTRVIMRLLEYELESAQEFCEVAHRLFTKRLKRFEAHYAAEKNVTDDVDAAVDQLEVLREHIRMSAQYGLVMVFASWERFLHDMYERTRFISTIPQLRDAEFAVDKNWLRTEEYLRYFKQLGMNMPSPPFAWIELEALRVFRNAIAHQSGRVTEQNIAGLKKYENERGEPYKLGDTLNVNAEFVIRNIETVRNTSRLFVQVYLERLVTLGIEV